MSIKTMMMKILCEDKLSEGKHIELSVKRDKDAQAVIIYLAITKIFFCVRVDVAPPYIYSPYSFFKGKNRFEEALEEFKKPEAQAAIKYAKTLQTIFRN